MAHIIGITETWCNSTVLDSEVAIDGYQLYRFDKDSVSGKGGGVILYIHESFSAVECHEIQNHKFNTSVWCEVKLEKK